MDIVAVLAQLKVYQLSLSITAPVAMSVKAAHEYPPDRDSVLPDWPCWINTWTFVGMTESAGGRRQQEYTIGAQFFVYDADLSRAARIATAFHKAWVDEMNLHNKLGGAATLIKLRGGNPTLGLFKWGDRPFVGLDEFLDVTLIDSTVYGI